MNRAHISMVDLVAYMGIGEKVIFTWVAGDKVPNEESYKKLLEVKEELESGKLKITPGGIHKDKSGDTTGILRDTRDTINPESTPTPRPHPPRFQPKRRAKRAMTPPLGQRQIQPLMPRGVLLRLIVLKLIFNMSYLTMKLLSKRLTFRAPSAHSINDLMFPAGGRRGGVGLWLSAKLLGVSTQN